MTSNEEKPSLASLLQTAIDGKLCDVHTSLPGIVKSYDRATQTAKIQPAIKRKYTDGRIVDLPIINKVPIMFPRSNGKFVHFDLVEGDEVTLVFSERSLDNWKERGGVVSPDDSRKFNLSDAKAYPGGSSIPKAFAPNGPAGSIEMSNGTNHLMIEEDGKFTMKNSGGLFEMDPSGKFKVTNNTEELLDLLSQTLELLSTTTTNTIFGPMQLNDFLEFAVLKNKIDTLKG